MSQVQHAPLPSPFPPFPHVVPLILTSLVYKTTSPYLETNTTPSLHPQYTRYCTAIPSRARALCKPRKRTNPLELTPHSAHMTHPSEVCSSDVWLTFSWSHTAHALLPPRRIPAPCQPTPPRSTPFHPTLRTAHHGHRIAHCSPGTPGLPATCNPLR